MLLALSAKMFVRHFPHSFWMKCTLYLCHKGYNSKICILFNINDQITIFFELRVCTGLNAIYWIESLEWTNFARMCEHYQISTAAIPKNLQGVEMILYYSKLWMKWERYKIREKRRRTTYVDALYFNGYNTNNASGTKW